MCSFPSVLEEVTAIACKMGHSCSAVPFELCNLIKQDDFFIFFAWQVTISTNHQRILKIHCSHLQMFVPVQNTSSWSKITQLQSSVIQLFWIVSMVLDLCIFHSWFRRKHSYFSWKQWLELKRNNDGYAFASQDVNWWTGVVWILCGLLRCFYQLFGLSFWRHPFTAEDPLVSKWCNVKFLQICFDEETNSSTSCRGLRVSKYLANFNFCMKFLSFHFRS